MIFNKEKQLEKWKKIRTIGKWKYILLYGLVLASTIFFVIRLLLEFILYGKINDVENYLIQAVAFGLTIGIINWFYFEHRYKKHNNK